MLTEGLKLPATLRALLPKMTNAAKLLGGNIRQ